MNRVTPELRRAVLLRDQGCLLARFHPDHVCRDAWGVPHTPGDLDKLTMEHVHEGYGLMGRRAPSDLGHLVAMCWSGNVGVPSKADRALMRDYLRVVA